MTSIVNNLINELKANGGNTDYATRRKEIVKKTEIVKVAAAAVIIASAILFAAFASLGTFCILFPIAYVAYEIGTLANNYQKTFDNWQTAIKTSLSDRQLLLHMTEWAPVSRSITKIAGLV